MGFSQTFPIISGTTAICSTSQACRVFLESCQHPPAPFPQTQPRAKAPQHPHGAAHAAEKAPASQPHGSRADSSIDRARRRRRMRRGAPSRGSRQKAPRLPTDLRGSHPSAGAARLRGGGCSRHTAAPGPPAGCPPPPPRRLLAPRHRAAAPAAPSQGRRAAGSRRPASAETRRSEAGPPRGATLGIPAAPGAPRHPPGGRAEGRGRVTWPGSTGRGWGPLRRPPPPPPRPLAAGSPGERCGRGR